MLKERQLQEYERGLILKEYQLREHERGIILLHIQHLTNGTYLLKERLQNHSQIKDFHFFSENKSN